jgi:hypothetical protein
MSNPAPLSQVSTGEPVERLDTLTGYVILLGNVIKLLTNPHLPAETGPGSPVGRMRDLISFAQLLLIQGDEGAEEMDHLNAHVQQLVEQGRGPSPEEWTEWEERFARVDARFQAVHEQLDPPDASTSPA